MRRILLTALLLLTLAFAPRASADVENRNLFPIGQREAFLGNSGVAGVRSTGSMYYNPAALSQLKGLNLSVSSSAYLSYSIRAEPLVVADGAGLDFGASGFSAIPSSTISTYSLSKKATLALGILVPETLEYNDRNTWKTDNFDIDVAQSQKIQDIWLGGGVGVRVGKRLSIGGALFITKLTEVSTVFSITKTTSASDTISTIGTFEDFTSWGLLASFGATLQLSPKWRIGAVIKLPSFQLAGSGSYFREQDTVDAGTLTTTRETDSSATFNHTLPLDHSLGVIFTPSRELGVLLDLSLQLGTKYQEVPGYSESDEVDTKLTPRLNTGLYYSFSKSLRLLSGFFLNPSSESSTASDALNQPLSYLGGTLGLEYRRGRVITGAGIYYARASGDTNISGTSGSLAISVFSGLLSFTYFL